MPEPKPRPWSILNGEEGTAIVVPALTSVESGLTEMIDQVIGERFMTDNPAIVREARDHRIRLWRSCSKYYREFHGLDPDESYWAEDGDGARSIEVLYVDRSLDAIAEEAASLSSDRIEEDTPDA